MGQHKYNQNTIKAKNGELPPKKKHISKHENEALLKKIIADKTGLTNIYQALERYGD